MYSNRPIFAVKLKWMGSMCHCAFHIVSLQRYFRYTQKWVKRICRNFVCFWIDNKVSYSWRLFRICNQIEWVIGILNCFSIGLKMAGEQIGKKHCLSLNMLLQHNLLCWKIPIAWFWCVLEIINSEKCSVCFANQLFQIFLFEFSFMSSIWQFFTSHQSGSDFRSIFNIFPFFSLSSVLEHRIHICDS